MHAVEAAIRSIKPVYLVLAVAAAISFICAEGWVIWYLMHALDKKTRLLSCMKYSFIGFFFSGITPSASGGQPAQVYYMSREGKKLSDCTVVLMTVAVIYKFVLVLMGIGILLFAHQELAGYLGAYLYVYYLGLLLNIILVVLLLFVMIRPKVFQKMVFRIEVLLVRIHILKASEVRRKKLEEFVNCYRQTIQFFLKNKHRIVAAILFTIVQRVSVVVLTYFIYLGFSLRGTSAMTVMILQASVYVAVEILPLPGAQGITEMMYRKIFAQVFPGNFLTASMCVTRSINFYFLMILSAGITLWCYIRRKVKMEKRRSLCVKRDLL